MIAPSPTLPPPVAYQRAKHPARFSKGMLAIFARYLERGWRVLDPLAGSGKIGKLKGWRQLNLTIVCNELEREWAINDQVDDWNFGDAAHMDWAGDEAFDAVITSPTYGNRMADTYTDATKRITYTAGLGRRLHPANTGSLQWGAAYREKHVEIYRECVRVLKTGGLFIVNISDHIRDGRVIPVSTWHRDALLSLGLELLDTQEIATPRVRYGQNHDKRVGCENIYVFRKVGA